MPRSIPPEQPPVEPPVETRREQAGEPGDSLVRPADLAPGRWAPRRAPVVSTGSIARFEERAAMRRRIRRDRALAAAGAVVGLGAVGWLLLLSPVLALDAGTYELRVDGVGSVVDTAAVTAIVAGHDGVPLPRLDTVALRREVLDVPGVRAASVTRSWPHGLLVSVVARDPVAAVPAEGGVVLLDADGVQVGRADAPPPGLPLVEVPLGGDTRAMTAVLLVLQQLPDDLAAQVAGASAESQDTVRLTLVDGAVVEWGSADQNALKARVLATLRASAAAPGVRVYDVSAPTLPITRS